ncbi:MAG: tetratricopeptide repeat-containing sensor histidine kinase [Bacteroidetes bacterium]|nr:tetratricopeptide repeat-containing sensor histidine kinase [Bacteroidota bacterium]
MTRWIFSLILLITLYPFSNGLSPVLDQNDSLSSSLQHKSDSSRISDLLTLCWENRNSAPEISVNYGTEALDLAIRNNDFISQAKAYSFVGVAYRVMGKYSKSLDFYYTGLEVALKHEIPEQAAYSYLNLANLYVYQELASLASENLKKAEALGGNLGNKRILAYINLYSGRIYSLEDKPDSALISYRKSLLLRQELNQVAEQANCYRYMGDIYFQKDSLLTAIENYNMSLKKVDKKNDKDLYANLLIMKSQIFIRGNKIYEASGLAHESLKIAEGIGAKRTIRDALQVLSEISFITKDYKTASDLQRRVIQYDDSLFSKQLSEKIFFLEYQMEREQRNAKIDLLNKDNSIKELQLKRGRFIRVGLTIIIVLLVTVFVVLLILLKQRRKHEKLLELNNLQIIEQRDSIELQNRQLTDTNERLGKSEEELKKIVQTKDKLLSIIAHDLRNPFAALIGLTELLHQNADTIDKEELKQYVTMINESSHKLLLLIENLLAWARSQTGALKPVRTDLNLKSQTEDVMKLYISQAEAKGISLINDIPGNISVYADQKILATIFRNLISNGIKYTNKGGSVTCSAFTENGRTVLKVCDTGIGMSEAQIKKLFRIGETLTTEGTGSESGTGLGLVICKEFTETLEGTITVESSVGAGTSFFVTLPASQS